MFRKNKKIINCQAGMTYVELIVVMAIFTIMAGILFFKYGDFGKQIDIQNLSQDIALQIVTAQKDALSGVLPNPDQAGYSYTSVQQNPSWRPAYGVYFSTTNQDATKFIPFIDAKSEKIYDTTLNCDPGNSVTRADVPNQECTDLINIGKGDKISNICLVSILSSSTTDCLDVDSVSITFTRPDSSAVIANFLGQSGVTKAIITVSDQSGNFQRSITVYSSGRVEVN